MGPLGCYLVAVGDPSHSVASSIGGPSIDVQTRSGKSVNDARPIRRRITDREMEPYRKTCFASLIEQTSTESISKAV